MRHRDTPPLRHNLAQLIEPLLSDTRSVRRKAASFKSACGKLAFQAARSRSGRSLFQIHLLLGLKDALFGAFGISGVRGGSNERVLEHMVHIKEEAKRQQTYRVSITHPE